MTLAGSGVRVDMVDVKSPRDPFERPTVRVRGRSVQYSAEYGYRGTGTRVLYM